MAEITLIGAGLAGSLLAIFLARRGHRVTIYERRPDLRKVEISAGRSINLALANRGIRALAEVGLMQKVDSLMIPMVGRMLHHQNGELQLLPYGNKPEEVIYSISRGGLNALLMDAAEATGNVTIQFGHACRDIDFDRGVARIETDELGLIEISFEIVIGTDGSASAVRDSIIGQTKGISEHRPLDHSYKELAIPPGDNGEFRMSGNALHIWPRGEFMLIALPNIDGSFTVTLFLPNSGPTSFSSITDPTSLHDFFQQQFPDAIPLIPGLQSDFFQNPTGHLETVRCHPWSFGGQALLLGDAAHAIVPFHGQGMNCAFEDCSALDECLGGSGDWPSIFLEFERIRKPNADAIAEMALENYVEMRSSVREPKFQLKKELSFRLEERHPHRFVPRYSMVMFHSIPYAEAQRLGTVINQILDDLTEGKESIDQIDFSRAERLIEERLPSRIL